MFSLRLCTFAFNSVFVHGCSSIILTMPSLTFARSILSPREIASSPVHRVLILPSILPILQLAEEGENIIAIEAHKDELLVGLTIGEIIDRGVSSLAQFYSIVILPNYRGQGIGNALFGFTQEVLKGETVTSIELFYTLEDPHTPKLQAILRKHGWTYQKNTIIQFYFDFPNFNPKWLFYSYRLPNSMHLFSWKELTQQERGLIDGQARQGRFPVYLNPFLDELVVDKEVSVGLRFKEQVIGWSLVQRMDSVTFYYSSLYIDNHYLSSGLGILLLVESLKRHKKTSVPVAMFEVNLNEMDSSWAHFVRKRLAPLAQEVKHIYHAVKLFNLNNK